MRQACGDELDELKIKWRARLADIKRQQLVDKKVLREHIRRMMEDGGLDEAGCLTILQEDLRTIGLHPRILEQLKSVESTPQKYRM